MNLNPNATALIERVNAAKLAAHDENWINLARDLAQRLNNAGRGGAAARIARTRTLADFQTQCGRIVAGLVSAPR